MKAKLLVAILVVLGLATVSLASVKAPSHQAASFVKDGQISWMHDEPEALAQAKALNRPVMIDFYADWCSSCMELDKRTYTDARVRDAIASKFVPLKVDCTDEDSPTVKALETKYNITQLPTVLFVDPSGHTLENPRILNFLKPDPFLAELTKVH